MLETLRTSSLVLLNGLLQMHYESYRLDDGEHAVSAMKAIATELNIRWRKIC